MSEYLRFGIILLSFMLIKNSIQKTITENWASIPTNCLRPWTPHSEGLKISAASLASLSLSNTDPLQSFIGFKCDDETMSSCEGLIPTNETNVCMKEFKTGQFKIMVKKEVIPSIDKELYIWFENDGKFMGASDPSLTVEVPPLSGEIMSAEFRNGIVSCDCRNRNCQFLAKGGKVWETFPPMIYDHCRGSLNNVGGKLVAIGGATPNIFLTPHRKVEIFKGSSWVPLPDLMDRRRGFATVVINSTSLVMVGGTISGPFAARQDFLMYHVNTNKWVSLPDYPYHQFDLVCCNLDNGTVRGILCLGGDGPPDKRIPSNNAMFYDWNLSSWYRTPLYDFWIANVSRGAISQFKNWLYYIPFENHQSDNVNFVARLNMNDMTPTWEKMGMIVNATSPFHLFLELDLHKFAKVTRV